MQLPVQPGNITWICVKVFDGSKWIVNISKVIRLKQHANLNPKLIFRGPLATTLSNALFPGEGVVWAIPEVGAEPARHLTPAPPIVWYSDVWGTDQMVAWSRITPDKPPPTGCSCLTPIIHEPDARQKQRPFKWRLLVLPSRRAQRCFAPKRTVSWLSRFNVHDEIMFNVCPHICSWFTTNPF